MKDFKWPWEGGGQAHDDRSIGIRRFRSFQCTDYQCTGKRDGAGHPNHTVLTSSPSSAMYVFSFPVHVNGSSFQMTKCGRCAQVPSHWLCTVIVPWHVHVIVD